MNKKLERDLGKIMLINMMVMGFLFFCSCLVGSLGFNFLEKLSGEWFGITRLGIGILSLFIFYISFVLLLIVYYRSMSKIIGKNKELVIDSNDNPKEWIRQVYRIILDYTIVKLIAPFIDYFPVFLKLLGAKLGRGVTVMGKIYTVDLVEIGDNTIVAVDSIISGHVGNGDVLTFRKVKIGNNCIVGVKTLIMPGVEIGDNSVIAAGSIVLKDTKIPTNEIWGGIPARRIKSAMLNSNFCR